MATSVMPSPGGWGGWTGQEWYIAAGKETIDRFWFLYIQRFTLRTMMAMACSYMWYLGYQYMDHNILNVTRAINTMARIVGRSPYLVADVWVLYQIVGIWSRTLFNRSECRITATYLKQPEVVDQPGLTIPNSLPFHVHLVTRRCKMTWNNWLNSGIQRQCTRAKKKKND